MAVVLGCRERFPITWNHVIEKKPLKIKESEHVLIEKVEQFFGICLVTRAGESQQNRRHAMEA